MIPGLFGDKSEGGGGGFMMPNLFLVFLMSLGIVASEKPVRSHRPVDTTGLVPVSAEAEAASQQDEILRNQGLANHLWEDPLTLLSKTGGKKPPALGKVYVNWLKESLDRDKLCLVVGLPGGKAPATVEKRLRIRSAVSSALLAKEGYHFLYGESLQVAQWESKAFSLAEVEQSDLVNVGYSRLYRPYEDKDEKETVDSKLSKYESIFLLYVDEGAWGGDFGKNIMSLFSELRPARPIKEREDWAYVGLTNSHRLHQFVEESYETKASADGQKKGELSSKYPRWMWENFRVITPHATVDDEVLVRMFRSSIAKEIFDGVEFKTFQQETRKFAQGLLSNSLLGNERSQMSNMAQSPIGQISREAEKLRVERLMAHDGMLSKGLIAELKARHINPEKSADDEVKHAVLLLSEMDSFYGRSIATTFRTQWNRTYPGYKNNLRTMHYQLGLDGHKANPTESPDDKDGKGAVQLELAEGRSQIDSVARLVGRIRIMEKLNKIKFKAIGVLGSDVYDKLLLLRALRPEFQDTRFFSTDLDARLWQGPERKSARNLIIASSPLFHAKHKLGVPVPPFRSHYQLGTYEAVLRALRPPVGEDEEQPMCRPSNELGIFEIGKKGPIFIGGYLVDEEGICPLGRGHETLKYPQDQFSFSHYSLLLTMILGVFVYCIWPHLAPWWRRNSFEGISGRDWSVGDRALIAVYSVVVVILMGFVIRLQKGCLETQEPLRLLDGVSVWPTVIFDILVSMLALCWLIRSWDTLRSSHNNLKSCFPFNSGITVSPALGSIVGKFDAGGALGRRLLRTFGILVGYFLIYRFFLLSLPSQSIENLAHGDIASKALEQADWISHTCMAILLFFIADAVFQFSRALQFGMVMVREKKFDDVVPSFESQEKGKEEARTWAKPGMSEKEAKAIIAALEKDCPQPYWQTSMLELAMKRASTIGSLLYYPFICLFFLFIARNAVFDDFALSERLVWTYLLVFALLAGGIIYSQIALKKLFQKSSASIQEAIQNNPETVSKYYKRELKILKALEKESSYRIFNNPLFKAAIIPIGGSGILELVSHIAPALRGG